MHEIHRYACTKCRSRKIKCDRIDPTCCNCFDAGAQCSYVARRPRKSQRPRPVAHKPLLPAERSYLSPTSTSPETLAANPEQRLPMSMDDISSDEDSEDIVIPHEVRDSAFEAHEDHSQINQGKLFVAQGKSRYINGDKANQVGRLESILAAEPRTAHENDRLPGVSQASRSSNTNRNTLLTTSASRCSTQSCHPPPEIMHVLWDHYVRNVDILVKILYKPFVEKTINCASSNLQSLSGPKEALLIAVWFAAVTAMSKESCFAIHKEDRNLLLSRYRQGLEQALARAEWMTSLEVEILQALILLMVCAPSKTARSTWVMSGIALSIAQAMGMHSDSATFGLGLVETEVRRRVWWTLCQIDDRISGDCGLEPHAPLFMDTKLPRHINDSDLDPNGHILPISRTEFTEMTATIMKIKVTEISLKAQRCKWWHSDLNTTQVNDLSRDRIRQFEVYLTYLDLSIPLHRVLDLGARLIIARTWKMTYDHQRQSSEASTGTINEALVFYNANILEITSQFSEDLRQFNWFFRCRYMQWHAMAYLLIELSKYPDAIGPAVDRAWDALDSLFDRRRRQDGGQNSHTADSLPQNAKSPLWIPLSKLYKRAKEAKIRGLHTENPESEAANERLADESLYRPYGDVMLTGDPFLGILEFDEEASWEHMNAWLKDIQPNLTEALEMR